MTSGGRAGTGLCRARESLVHCPPCAVYPPWPPHSPGVGAACLHLLQVGRDHLPWRGAQQSLRTARGQSGLRWTDSVTGSRTAATQHLGSCKRFKQGGREGKRSLSSDCCPFLGGRLVKASPWPFGSLLRRPRVPWNPSTPVPPQQGTRTGQHSPLDLADAHKH